jgi:hypothetical protein
MEQTAFNAYAYHQQKIDDFVNLLAAAADHNDGQVQRELLSQVGLSPEDLSTFDLNYIEREVNRR